MATILILYSTIDGHTRTICERLREVIESNGHQVTLRSIDDEGETALEPFDKIVIGASIRYGKHRQNVAELIRAHREQLAAKPGAFFSVNVVARKPNKNRPDTNPYLKKFLAPLPWTPTELAVFAGRIDYPRCSLFDRQMIRLIMWITHGPTDPTAAVEFTDWSEVEAFGQRIANM